jgi:hypothetical protein
MYVISFLFYFVKYSLNVKKCFRRKLLVANKLRHRPTLATPVPFPATLCEQSITAGKCYTIIHLDYTQTLITLRRRAKCWGKFALSLALDSGNAQQPARN